ncbi:ImmA/IrrE family metallo-endopeptidase, partial [Gallibacterium salpingitidis]
MGSIFYEGGYIVPPRSKMDIDKITRFIRLANPQFINDDGAIDILALLEHGYQNFSVVPDNELHGILGLTLPSGEILLRESVYEGACDGNGRDRFTIAHEIGHGTIHKDYIGLARPADNTTKIYCNAEWQANEFAGRLLLPDSCLEKHKYKSFSDIAEMYGVS